MENKALEQEFKKAFMASYTPYPYAKTADKLDYLNEYKFNNVEAAKKCSEITLEYIEGIIEFYAKTVPIGHFSTGENNGKTTEQLINLYFESLNKKP